MDLLLWGHAEAEDGIADFKRKLTSRGEKQAKQMATWLKTHAPEDLHIIASPAKRCQQTAQALDRPFETDPRLGPGNSVNGLLAFVDWPDGARPNTTPFSSSATKRRWVERQPCCSRETKPNGRSRKDRCGGSATRRGFGKRRRCCGR